LPTERTAGVSEDTLGQIAEGELLVRLCFDDAEDDRVEVPEPEGHEAKRIGLGHLVGLGRALIVR
jgi:hypothetical protein